MPVKRKVNLVVQGEGNTEMKKADTLLKKSVSRRSVLKGGAAIAGATAITGFPTVWAQNIKDITLNHTGMSYSTIADIARQATLDLGFKVEMSVVDHPGLTNRMIQDPNSIDIADSEIWQTKVYVPAGVTQAVDTKKIAIWDKITTLYRKARLPGSRYRAREIRRTSSCIATPSTVRPSMTVRPSGRRSCPARSTPTRWASGRT
jgi:hypothetical protein